MKIEVLAFLIDISNSKKPISTNIKDLCLDKRLNSFVIHRNKTGDNFDFSNATLINKEHNYLCQEYLKELLINILPIINT